MAIVNVTPDSFADAGERFAPDVAVADAVRMVEQGADILDIGGESTRPGAAPLPEAEELARVMPVIEELRRRVEVPLSIDTYKAGVAARAIDAGAAIVNDVSALTYDPDLAGVVRRAGVPVILMHTRGRPADMYAGAQYEDVAREVRDELRARVDAAIACGIDRTKIIVDPGLGFAKRAAQSLAAIAGLPVLAELGLPLLSGPSRKSFLTAGLGERAPRDRVWGTAAAVAASVLFGAHIVRVHDVAEMIDVVRVADQLRGA